MAVNLNPSLFAGNSGEDAIELLCIATVAEDVMSASYRFKWMKDDTPLDISNDRIVVCKAVFIRSLNCIDYVFIITNIILLFIGCKINYVCNQSYRLPAIIASHHLPSKPLTLMLH